MKLWAITMGVGVAVGAVAVMMLPRQSSARRLVSKAADITQDAVHRATDKIVDIVDM